MDTAIEVNNLKKSFDGHDAVRGVNLHIKRGELFALLGPNGAGKTTIIHMLSTLLQPDSGEAFIGGSNVVTAPAEVRRKISLTGQFAALDDELSGAQNLELIARLHGYSVKQARAKAEELIQTFDLTDARNRLVTGYSGGMRRRLDIAASIMTKPDLIFLDEPTTGLDPQSRNHVWEIIRKLVQSGTTIFLTTQYLEEADQLADQIAVIHEGTIIAEGTPGQLKASIGEKTLSFRLIKPYHLEKIDSLLMHDYNVHAFLDENPLIFKVPVKEARLANQVVHTLLSNGVPIDDFALSDPSLDEVFLELMESKNKEWTH